MLPGFSAPATAQCCTASHCPIGFTLQSGLRKIPKRSGSHMNSSLPSALILNQKVFWAHRGKNTEDLQIRLVQSRNTSCRWNHTAVVFVSRRHVAARFPLPTPSTTLGLGAAACQGADFVTNAKSVRGYISISFFDQIPVLSVWRWWKEPV